MPPLLTIGFSTRDDRLAWMTVNSLLAHHSHLLDRLEILIVDNSPAGSPFADELATHLAGQPRVRYLRVIGPESSCLYKDRVFQEARGTYVLQCDSHVLFPPGSIDAVLDYFTRHPDSRDLIMGPCLNRGDRVLGTDQLLYADPDTPLPAGATLRHGVVCRGGQLGVWVKDPRGLDPAGEPYEIQQQGTGAFACRRDAWPGFHPAFTGFGGNEPYLMESFRARGDRVLCLPAFRWVHCFYRPEGPSYRPLLRDKVRNYLVGFAALGRDNLEAAALEHFRATNPRALAVIDQAAESAAAIAEGLPDPHATESPAATGDPAAVKKPQRTADPVLTELRSKLPDDKGGSVPEPLAQMLLRLPSQLKTLEFGAGLSTLCFDRAGTDHTAVEHNPAWADRVRPLVHPDRTQVIHAPLTPSGEQSPWYDWQPAYGTLYNLILIDGPPGYNPSQPGRSGALGQVESLLAPGGMIIVDDTQRAAERQLAAALGERLGLAVQQHGHGDRRFAVLTAPQQLAGEGPGTELTRIFDAADFPKCQRCQALAQRMNAWGVAGCREHLDEIVADIFPRAQGWLKARHKWAQKLLGAAGLEEPLLKREIEKHVLQAIAHAEQRERDAAATAAAA